MMAAEAAALDAAEASASRDEGVLIDRALATVERASPIAFSPETFTDIEERERRKRVARAVPLHNDAACARDAKANDVRELAALTGTGHPMDVKASLCAQLGAKRRAVGARDFYGDYLRAQRPEARCAALARTLFNAMETAAQCIQPYCCPSLLTHFDALAAESTDDDRALLHALANRMVEHAHVKFGVGDGRPLPPDAPVAELRAAVARVADEVRARHQWLARYAMVRPKLGVADVIERDVAAPAPGGEGALPAAYVDLSEALREGAQVDGAHATDAAARKQKVYTERDARRFARHLRDAERYAAAGADTRDRDVRAARRRGVVLEYGGVGAGERPWVYRYYRALDPGGDGAYAARHPERFALYTGDMGALRAAYGTPLPPPIAPTVA